MCVPVKPYKSYTHVTLKSQKYIYVYLAIHKPICSIGYWLPQEFMCVGVLIYAVCICVRMCQNVHHTSVWLKEFKFSKYSAACLRSLANHSVDVWPDDQLWLSSIWHLFLSCFSFHSLILWIGAWLSWSTWILPLHLLCSYVIAFSIISSVSSMSLACTFTVTIVICCVLFSYFAETERFILVEQYFNFIVTLQF